MDALAPLADRAEQPIPLIYDSIPAVGQRELPRTIGTLVEEIAIVIVARQLRNSVFDIDHGAPDTELGLAPIFNCDRLTMTLHQLAARAVGAGHRNGAS